MSTSQLSRRAFLGGAGGTALLLSGVAPLLAACGGQEGGDAKKKAVSREGVRLPTYVPYTGVKADLAGTQAGVRPGFLHYPKDKPKSVEGKVGAGSKVLAFANIYFPLPPSADRNKYWAGLNERLGVTFNMIMTPSGADFDAKFATLIAGSQADLPDLVQIRGTKPQLPRMLKSKFADLSEFLAGDAIKEYPNLAAIPTRAWKNAVYNGGIYGIPVPREPVGSPIFTRADVVKDLGLATDLSDAEDLAALATELTDKKTRWAYGSATRIVNMAMMMLKAPNSWRDDGGKLTNARETEEHKQAIDYATKAWKDGLVHPDAFGVENVVVKQWFNSGKIVLHYDGYPGWRQYVSDSSNIPDFDLDWTVLPGFSGGAGAIHAGGSIFSITGLKQASPERLKELLRICNYFAAPFGTSEYFYNVYGVEGLHHTVSASGDPKLTAAGQAETVLPIRYLAEPSTPIYEPGREEDVNRQHAYESKVIPTAILNPCAGLYSETEATKGAMLTTALDDLTEEIIQGRKPLSSWDDAMATWRSGGGDAIRAELEEQLQQQGDTAAK